MAIKKTYRKLCIAVLGAWRRLAMPTLIDTDTSRSDNIKNRKGYGNCRVWTEINMSTDAESHYLWYWESTYTDETIVAIFFESAELMLILSKGRMSRNEYKIPITLSIDKGKLINRVARWDSETGFATIGDTELALSVMNKLENGKRVVIKVGKERGSIILNGSKAAVRDFKQRIIQSINNADTSRGDDIENDKRYGNCRVWTGTDTESHHLFCREKTISDETIVGIHQSNPGELGLSLKTGDMTHSEGEIPIRFRIDKGKLIEIIAWWDGSKFANIFDTKLALSVMNELENGKRVFIEVGEKTGYIILEGASAAVRDFKQRIKLPSIDTYNLRDEDVKNNQGYGNWQVWTEANIFTDEECHSLFCRDVNLVKEDITQVLIYQSAPKELELVLNKYEMSHSEDKIPIKLRIDEGKVIKRMARWRPDPGAAYIKDTELALSVMNELAKGKRLTIQVGEERGEIILNGAFAAAVRDFKQRIKPSINADTSSRFDTENFEIYGNCHVWKEIDKSTDTESHHLSCMKTTMNDVAEVGIHQWAPKKLELHLSTGNMSNMMFHTEDEIPIEIETNKGERIKRNARWDSNSGFACIADTQLALSFMNELGNGKIVLFQVGEEVGYVIPGGASGAVRDFKQRIKPLINADTSGSFDTENFEIYGNCHVWTEIDKSTDAESYHMSCMEKTNIEGNFGVPEVEIHQWVPKKLELHLSTGDMLHKEKGEIPIVLRIDEAEWIERSAQWDSNSRFATIDDTQLALSVMDKLASGKNVVIMVGEKPGWINLNGAYDAVQDFKQRINDP